uniref:SANT domain-containing protein n=1 Tax=Macrostomum lignano TaxID=282301 RepID=A0A1I8FDZ7_9PLAT
MLAESLLLADRGEIRCWRALPRAEVQPAAGPGRIPALVSRAVGTLARAMDASSATRQPGLGLAAASAGRDCTQAHAYKTLHSNGYDLGRAFCALYGKDFHDIRQDFLPWKSMKAIVEYFYMWKTTDRYVQQKRLKAAEAERKLKQTRLARQPRLRELLHDQPRRPVVRLGPRTCPCRLCTACWAYWKRYGGLKSATRD